MPTIHDTMNTSPVVTDMSSESHQDVFHVKHKTQAHVILKLWHFVLCTIKFRCTYVESPALCTNMLHV